MDTRKVIDESAGPISLSAAFNSDTTCFSVGLNSGFCGTTIYSAGLACGHDANMDE